MSELYDNLVKRAESSLNNIHKNYLNGQTTIYSTILAGHGQYRMELLYGQGHDVHPVIDAIHSFYNKSNDQTIINGYTDGIYHLINTATTFKAFKQVIEIICYELEQNTDKLISDSNISEMCKLINIQIKNNINMFKLEYPSFGAWMTQKNSYVQHLY